MMLPRAAWIRWWKFNAVGAIGIVVQLIALAFFKSMLCLDYLLATALAVETAVVHNFLWHQRFTWADRIRGDCLSKFAKFNLTTGVFSIIGNLLLMKWLVETCGMKYLIANGLSIAACSIANFLVSDLAVFRNSERLTSAVSPNQSS